MLTINNIKRLKNQIWSNDYVNQFEIYNLKSIKLNNLNKIKN